MGCCKKKPLKIRTDVPFPRDTNTCQTPVCAVLFMICLLFMVVIGLWGWSENASVISLLLFLILFLSSSSHHLHITRLFLLSLIHM